MGPAGSDASQIFALRGHPRAIVLEEDGLHHPKTPRGGGSSYTPYEDVTHIARSSRVLWIGTRRSVFMLTRRSFVDPHGPDHLVRALLGRIARRPQGAVQLARMAEIEETSRAPGSLWATWGLAGLCGIVFILQLVGGDDVFLVGHYSRALTSDGDWWRLWTGNLLHAVPRFPIHLVLNLVGLLALGSLVERTIGSARTLCVMGAAALGGMLTSGLVNQHAQVVGVSGVVFGILGALAWLEFRCADELPAMWRVPRRALIWMLALSAGLPFLVPFIAGAAHLGGFLSGGLVAALLGGRPLGRRSSSAWARALAGGVCAVTIAALVAAGHDLLRPGDYAARHLARMGALLGLSPEELNDTAWIVAIDPDAPPERLEAALGLAERAADETEHEVPEILDTVAELHFQLGDRGAALAAIDEAIARAPDDSYYREQRRRFLGERDPDDRPSASGPFGLPRRDRQERDASGVQI